LFFAGQQGDTGTVVKVTPKRLSGGTRALVRVRWDRSGYEGTVEDRKLRIIGRAGTNDAGWTIIIHFRDGRAGFYRWRQGAHLSFSTPLRRLAWRGSVQEAERIVAALHRVMATGAHKEIAFADMAPLHAARHNSTMKEQKEYLRRKGYDWTPAGGWTFKGAPINPRLIAKKLDMEYTTLLAVQQSIRREGGAQRNGPPRERGGFFDKVYAGTVWEWQNYGVGLRIAKRFARMAVAYERLARKIDRDYSIGRFKGIEQKEVAAERMLEVMDSLRDQFQFGAEEEAVDREANLVHLLAVIYTEGPEARFGGDRASWINNMRANIVDAVRGWGKVKPTDEQVLEIARDATHRWKTLRERYMAARRKRA
jgi:hypothetical protein